MKIELFDGNKPQFEEGTIIASAGGKALAFIGMKAGAGVAAAGRVGELKSCPAAAVCGIDDEKKAASVAEKLCELFGKDTDCLYFDGAAVRTVKVKEIVAQKLSPCAAVAVEEADFLHKARYDFADLERIIRELRAPGGCPWDRVQTHASIKNNLVEEAYELYDAIERGNDYDMEEETGDVLMQAAFHSVLADERGAFSGGDALTRVVKKLIFRHSHIFGSDKATNDGEALSVWERNKNVEKHQTTFGETVAAVPVNFPACMRAQKVQKRAAKSGMDFLSSVSAGERLIDELKELIEALAMERGKEAVKDEAGDVLFSAVNTCRLAGVDCEEALRAATDKFARRFITAEKLIIADGKDITDLNELELDVYWHMAKDELKKN